MAKKDVRFEVIRDFKDLQDKNKIYRAGDSYPTPANKKITEKRLEQLKTKNNKNGIQYIREVAEAEEKK